jgi:endonuclease/exonuclease/phosphatase family metal-dependent hydrolase
VLVVVCGDFNIIRYGFEKSTGETYNVWMDMFNSFINDTALLEIHRGGERFTWTNKQRNPVMSNLDRFFVSKEWEQKFPKSRVLSLVRVGSDHSPLLMDDGIKVGQCRRRFRFENAWLSKPEFREKMIERWPKWREKKFRIIGKR